MWWPYTLLSLQAVNRQTVSVADANDETPEFLGRPYSFMVDEVTLLSKARPFTFVFMAFLFCEGRGDQTTQEAENGGDKEKEKFTPAVIIVSVL